ncbi:hypothetical protein SAMN02745702_00112 [Desulfobaculum bizertense DSM 18034]|uniref:Uncharacterized protein n=1 Tax=Desulfobaculum bizertense DSM 18034 TaxID=1121442 RepID=A0A1T4VEM1_9BACT|nr:hypothetical protein SAMN02745702_00112 [Desulfobaculum bizertense DSM 18034]
MLVGALPPNPRRGQPRTPRKGMIPLRILIAFKSRGSFASTAFKRIGASVESLFLFCVLPPFSF